MDHRKITYDQLKKAGACLYELDRFAEAFGTEVDVTVELAVSQADQWSWFFVANRLLSQTGSAQWDAVSEKAADVYRAAMAPRYAADKKASELAQEAFDKNVSAWRSVNPDEPYTPNEVLHTARVLYDSIMSPVWAETSEWNKRFLPAYIETEARTFAAIYIEEGQDSE